MAQGDNSSQFGDNSQGGFPQGGIPMQGAPVPQGFNPMPQGGAQSPSPSQYGQFNPGQFGNIGPASGSVPGMGMGAGIGTGAGTMPFGQQQPEDTSPANFQLGLLLPERLNVPVPGHETQFDEEKFIRLLASSISLSKDEKKRIIEAIPKLRDSQISELIRIFEEEKEKFAALSKKHVPQLEKLAKQHYNDWMDLEGDYQQQDRAQEDQSKADEIRRKLGLG